MAEERTLDQSPALSWLWGARVQRVDGPEPGLFTLTLFDQGEKQSLLLWVSPAQRGVGATRERPKGEAASAFVRRLRTKIENARLREAYWLSREPHSRHASALQLSFSRGPTNEDILVDFDPKFPNLLLMTSEGRVAGAADERALRARLPQRSASFEPSTARGIVRPESALELAHAGEVLFGDVAAKNEAALRQAARNLARAALKRAERKLQAITGDLERAQAAPVLRREANLLLCQIPPIARGTPRVRLLDESVEPPEWLEFDLDPARDGRENAELRFERARRHERGVAIAGVRQAEASVACERLRAFLDGIDAVPLDALAEQATALGLSLGAPQLGKKQRAEPQLRVPHRTFVGTGQARILVGKNAADNDTLTLGMARPHDHWLHVRGMASSHVVVPLERGQSLSPELLLDAAHLAVHFSSVRGESSAEIQHTERRYVRKPKGAAPGAVNLERERVLLLRVEPDRLARLLASERT